MTDRPILFSGPMVRAILDGRKTQTRRVLKLAGVMPDYIGPIGCQDDPTCWGWEAGGGGYITVEGDDKDHLPGWRNGWRDWRGAYEVGDRLWVREHCATWVGEHRDVVYRADETEAEWDALCHDARAGAWKIRPSIFMPRWASRLTLTVTDVRVQRVQEISKEDARGEGAAYWWQRLPVEGREPTFTAIGMFRTLWDSLNAKRGYGWNRNPWVVALTFRALKENIDRLEGAS